MVFQILPLSFEGQVGHEQSPSVVVPLISLVVAPLKVIASVLDPLIAPVSITAFASVAPLVVSVALSALALIILLVSSHARVFVN